MQNGDTPPAKLLIVDDETANMNALCDTLQDAGYVTQGFTSSTLALQAIKEQEFDLLLTDLMMPEMDGIELITAAQAIDRDLVAVVMTGHGAVDTAVEAMKAGAIDYIQKPFRLSKIQPVLTRALLVRRLRTENIQLREAVTLHSLTTAFTHELDWQTVVNKVADAAFEQSNQGTTSILVLSADGSSLQAVAARGAQPARQTRLLVPFDANLQRWITDMREAMGNPSGWNDTTFAASESLLQYEFGISMPMFAGGNFVGLLNCQWGQSRRTPTLGQLKTLSGLASAAASALEIALLLDQLHRANQDLERRVQERTRQLEVANSDLEAFSFSISHDLRAPLRTIDGFAGILLTEAAALSSDAGHCAESIRTGTRRMMTLIDDLLKLSRLGQQPLTKQPVRTKALAEQVADEVARGQDTSLNLLIDDIPDCMGDESLLKQVWVNLLGNAVKFTRRIAAPQIYVGARRQAGETVYFVRDNGAGFDMQHAKKLFGVFQRLHSAKEFEGTGIGLSIVQRIVARHGGRTWAEGAQGKGATFYFAIPDSAS
ncbi:MAG TPA: response regulator [Steroidobacteraceae bacterium]|nr:response regulator [Steroidobacteraceae bacterium]